MIRQAGSRLAALVRSLALVAVLVVGVPVALILAARARFGGGAPLRGAPAPADWEASRIKAALTDRLTEHTIADVVIRLSLIVAWIAVVVLVLTIVAELVHMVRHDGMAMPDIRGLGLSQSVARVIAAGLLVVIPMFGTPSRAIAGDGGRLLPEQRAVASLTTDQASTTVARPDNVWVTRAAFDQPDVGAIAHTLTTTDDVSAVTADAGRYVVRNGDSIYGIAERLVGPDLRTVADYAERLIELNLGNQMADGQWFTNAAFIDVGWVLEMPATGDAAGRLIATSDMHVVDRGESLWSIAQDHLDDGTRWPEIYEANQGRTFDDGRQLVDPDLIQPGWELDLPSSDQLESSDQVHVPARPDNVWPSSSIDDVPADDVVIDDVVIDDVVIDDVVIEGEQGRADRGQPAVQDLNDVSEPAAADADAAPTTVAPYEAVPDELAPVADAALPAWPESSGSDPAPTVSGDESDAVELLTFARAAMLSAGVLTLLAVRRRTQLRRARPRARLPQPAARPAATERTLRAIDTGDRMSRVDVAVRSAASSLIEQGPRVVAVIVAAEGDLELRLSAPAQLPAPWRGSGEVWHLDGTTPIELLTGEADRVGSPCPTIVQLGRDLDGRDVYVDLEACEAIEVGGPADQADAIVAAVATTLAGSVLAEVTTLVGLGIADEAFLGHRLHVPVIDSQRAFEAAREAIGSTATADRSTFELRSRAVTGEVWEPAVVLAGSTAGTLKPPHVRTGLAVVSASPIHGSSSRLAPDGDAWTLLPLGLRLVPIGLSPADIAAIAELVQVADPVSEAVPNYRPGPDDTIVDRDQLDATDDVVESAAPPEVSGLVDHSALEWRLMVRLLGPVEVVSADGEAVDFERSKTRELLAWLATHRRRSTRSAARTALWELDVRDATFANVVSEARRSLARLVEPPAGEEWVGRTMTEDLPLHDLVCTDVDLVEAALDAARLQPPAQAIATLSPVVELINGMPFDGTSYLWPDPEGITSNLVLLATSASAELAAHCLSIGDINGVFQATGRGLSVLPGHEELIGLRMQAHARAGDHAGVRQEWESYERVITSDPWSDGEPSPKLVDLRRELLNPSR